MGIKSETDATKFAKEAAEHKFDLVVSIGGDGSISDVVSRRFPLERQPKLGIIPAGTVNNLAWVLEIPLDIPAAIENLVTGDLTPLEVGQVNDSYMISTLTLGVLADTDLEICQQEKQKFGPVTFIFKGRKIIVQHNYYC